MSGPSFAFAAEIRRDFRAPVPELRRRNLSAPQRPSKEHMSQQPGFLSRQ